jgi:DNA-binding NarL/FixJ family response regulator
MEPGPVARLNTASRDTQQSEFSAINGGKSTTVIIEPRALIRDCLVKCLKSMKNDELVCAFASVSDWSQDNSCPTPSLVLLCTGERRAIDIEQDIAALARLYPSVLTVLLSEGEDVTAILCALDKGARGYISTSMSLEVVVEAMQLVRAGGIFVPASSLLASRNAASVDSAAPKGGRMSLFTERQMAVVEALRQGKSNKIIAYELNMRESTVKVHVRNIMKKLNARNRTEVAFRVTAMAGDTA